MKNLHWSLYFLLLTFGIIALGCGLGAAIFPLAGVIFDTGFTYPQLMMNGIRIMGFYFMMWAPGIALVVCVMRAYERNKKASAAAAPASTPKS